MRNLANFILVACCLAGGARQVFAGQSGETPQPSAAGLLASGREQIAHGDLDAAIAALILAREAAPGDPAIYNALADAYLKQGAEPMGVQQLEKSLGVDSTQVEARLRLADIHLRGRRWAEAGRLYAAVLHRDPANDTAALQLGRLYIKAKQPAGAAKVLEGYVGRHPEDDEAVSQYLGALAESGQDTATAAAAESVLRSRPQWVPALLVAARGEARSGRPEQALGHYLQVDKLQPLTGADAVVVGHCYVALEKDADAAAWFERALRDAPDSKVDWAEPAAACMRLKRWPEAASLYERKLAQDSTSVTTWVNYALCKQQSKEYEAGRRALLRAVALRPDFVMGQYNLATNYVLMDSTRAAGRAYEKVIRLAAAHQGEHGGELRQAYRYLSVTHLVEKNWSQALDSLDRVLRFDPKDVEMRLYRAQALFALNRKAEAKQDFETVLHLQPENKQAKKGLDLLAQYN
jgi:tetratricopeptide (TPR) repeat protein